MPGSQQKLEEARKGFSPRAWAEGRLHGPSTALLAPEFQLSKTALGLLDSSTVREPTPAILRSQVHGNRQQPQKTNTQPLGLCSNCQCNSARETQRV